MNSLGLAQGMAFGHRSGNPGLFLGNMGGVGILGVLGGLGILGEDDDWDDLKLICVKCSNPAAGGDSGCGIAVLNRK